MEVRPASDEDEVADVVALLARSAFGAAVGRLVEFPRCSPHGEVLVAASDGAIAGAACCVSFGATGWIGALGVAPTARRRGVGRALTEAAITWLHDRDARTVLLFATAMGRPLYEQLGFRPEGPATAWRGHGGTVAPPDGITLRALGEADRAACLAVDRATTGEARDPVLDAMRPPQGVAAIGGDDALHGVALVSPWGVGTSISALDEATGVALMAAATRDANGGSAVLVVPDANRPAAAALRGWGFAPANEGLRMRLGPPVDWRPERQFGLFNLFWG